MGDTDIRAARDRIETVEKRIAAMHDAGVDVAALRAQLAFAHHALRDGRLADIEAICDEVLGAARRLAELGSRASQVRTPAHGTPVQRDPSTETLQRVKVGRAQLAEEVRAAIDAEVKTQMQTAPAVPIVPLAARLEALESRLAEAHSPAPPPDFTPILGRLNGLEERLSELRNVPSPAQPDFAPMLGRLHDLEERLAALAAAPAPAQPDLAPVLDRLAAVEERLAAPAPAPDQGPLLEQLRAVEARLSELATQTQDGQGVAASVQALQQRLDAVEARPAAPAGPDAAAVAEIVRRTVDEAVPRQASELLREAIAKLPTRDDLHQIAETLRADLDWRLEKAAAEHGWCSLSDVQTTVRKSMAEQDPGSPGGSQLGRLEIAMAEFVQQSKEQQDRLIAALAERVVKHTKTLTRRMLVREDGTPEKPKARHETEELAPSFSSGGEGSSRMAAITVAHESAPAKAPTEMALDPVPPEVLEASRRQHGDTTMFTKRVEAQQAAERAEAIAAQDPPAVGEAMPAEQAQPDLHDLVTAEVERALRGAAAASTMTEMPAPGEGSSSSALPATSNDQRATVTAPALAAGGSLPADLPVLIAAEVGRQLAMTVPVHLPPSDGDLARAIARVLPQALQDEAVRSELFATLALEAAGKPGVLGELTGLRRYLKRELALAAEHLGQPAATR